MVFLPPGLLRRASLWLPVPQIIEFVTGFLCAHFSFRSPFYFNLSHHLPVLPKSLPNWLQSPMSNCLLDSSTCGTPDTSNSMLFSQLLLLCFLKGVLVPQLASLSSDLGSLTLPSPPHPYSHQVLMVFSPEHPSYPSLWRLCTGTRFSGFQSQFFHLLAL